ncbi:hypothetical protein EMIHUDRAFT_452018 [Emiliania huxleyi CCMP1516]|uniref:NAD(P)-binding protein n=2 Tax=Emiliania huxleyi TaxID=2903 RepID=A0A0D3IPB0_EMIH1|nr:hypothetical protein EMIHUDRAFT_452018 [Emiliania huxleyi CCMP1516]EOD13095.1 hypothetical protein EMIHUDRAFT_452018 [Emiliania huxleyi CCMP1516]|eukprot:XP_005765524.1 hypothetical protein EMIHUDRAFT_452018 [Emiliania huxleyi CCMP1516]
MPLPLITAIALTASGEAAVPEDEYAALPEWTAKLSPFASRFAGKKVLVTGGSSGIGLAAALGFRNECADVVIAGSSSAKAQRTADALRSQTPSACPGVAVHAVAGNLANETQALGVVAEAIRLLGGLDVAVNAAGMAGMLYSMHAEIKHWVDTGKRGSVVNVGSLCGEHAGVCGTMYTASKFATQGFSKQAAVKYAPRGIRVNMLRDDYGERLGPDDPKWTEGRKAISRATRSPDRAVPGEPGELATPAAPRQAVDRAIPLGSIAEPWEMAGPILFLSDNGRASYVTGATLSADGALTQARAPSRTRGALGGRRSLISATRIPRQVGAFNSEVAAIEGGIKAPPPTTKSEL